MTTWLLGNLGEPLEATRDSFRKWQIGTAEPPTWQPAQRPTDRYCRYIL